MTIHLNRFPLGLTNDSSSWAAVVKLIYQKPQGGGGGGLRTGSSGYFLCLRPALSGPEALSLESAWGAPMASSGLPYPLLSNAPSRVPVHLAHHCPPPPHLQGGGVSFRDSFGEESFVRGTFLHTSNFGAGPSDAGNFNTPNPWCQVDPQRHRHSGIQSL